jgi:rhodanese-related sulfurtransferase
MKKIIIATSMIVMMLVFSGVTISATTNKFTDYESKTAGFKECPINITVHEAWAMLTDTGDGIQIPIDVRYDYEWYAGFIDTPFPESPVWNTLDLLKNETTLLEFMEKYDGAELILYCKGGYRSLLGSYILCGEGFNGTVYNMEGGITEWIAQGYPIRNNTQPSAPTIDGPTTVTKNVDYDFIFSAEDAENDGVYFWVEWCGDGHCAKWNGPYQSGEDITLNHSFHQLGTYSIRAKTKDFYDNESGWTEFEITVARTRSLNHNLFERFFDRFPNAFTLIKLVLGL